MNKGFGGLAAALLITLLVIETMLEEKKKKCYICKEDFFPDQNDWVFCESCIDDFKIKSPKDIVEDIVKEQNEVYNNGGEYGVLRKNKGTV